MNEFYLKILSGNHLGAEIPLEPGQHSLGKGELCDLVLTDNSLHETELVIEISEDGLLTVVSQADDPLLYVNGMPSGPAAQINAFDILTASNLFFALGPAEDSWPDLPLPELKRPEPKPEEPPTLEDNETDENDDFPDTLDELDDLENDNTELSSAEEDDLSALMDDDDEPEEDSDDEDLEDEFENPFANISRKWLIGIPAGIIFLAIMIIILLSGSSSEEDLPAASYLEQAKEIRATLRQKNVKLKELPDQSILISGYTLTMNDKQSLQRALRERNIPFSSQMVIMSELRANADALLKNRGYQSLSLELDNSPGSLVMTGYVASTEELSQVAAMLKQEVHGLVSIVDQVENQAGRLNTLKSMLREKGLSPRIHLKQKPNQITLEGHLLDDEQVYNLNDVVTRFRKRYGKRPELRVATKTAGAPAKVVNNKLAPSLDIRSVSMGRVPFVTMADGAKYLIGAKLANGYIIEDINLEYLLLSKGTDRIKYRLGGNRGGPNSRQ